MYLREITEEMVRTIIEEPDQAGDSFRGRRLARRTLDDEAIEVVLVEEGDTIVVVTVYRIEEA